MKRATRFYFHLLLQFILKCNSERIVKNRSIFTKVITKTLRRGYCSYAGLAVDKPCARGLFSRDRGETETKPETEAETEALTIQAEVRPRPRPSELETETRPRRTNCETEPRHYCASRRPRDRGVKTEATSLRQTLCNLELVVEMMMMMMMMMK